MIIAVNTRIQKKQQPDGYENLLFTCLRHLSENHPQHQFIYIFDSVWDEKLIFAKNAQPIIAGPQTSNSLRLQYWLNFKLPKVLRQHKADVFLSMEGICSMRTKKPQCVVITNWEFLEQPKTMKKWLAGFYKKFTPLFLEKAKAVVAVSDYSKNTLTNQYKTNNEKIDLIHFGVDEIFKPVDWEEKENIKEKYTEGKAYFLFSGKIDERSNYINLLKAFSFFKKRLKTNMMLVFAGNANDAFKKDLKTYKLRNDVKLLENLSATDLAKVTASAYAMVYPVLHNDLAIAALQAMQCQIPVICSNTGALPSICEKAAHYCNPTDINSIAENMMLVYKDEEIAKQLVEAGKTQIQKHGAAEAAELLMQSIQKAYNS